MEEIPELGSPRFDLSLDVDDADLLEVLLTEDDVVIPPETLEENGNDLSTIKLSTTSSMPKIKEEPSTKKTAIKSEVEAEEALSNDPNELKKQRRLIRNRMSAQLHRERKKAYIDKLEAEVKQRDSTINLLGLRISELENENKKLRQMLANNGPTDKFVDGEIESFDLGFTTHEESCDSDGSEGSSIGSRKRQASPESDLPGVKSARINPGTILASLAFLFLFRASIFDKGVNKAANSLVPVHTSPVRQGRVLFGVKEQQLDGSDDETSSLALVASPVHLDRVKPEQESMNKSYFFCPTKFHQTASGSWTQSNKTDFSQSRVVPKQKRRLRAKESQTDFKIDTPDSSLVLRDTQRVPQEHATPIEEDAFRQLTLVVPSSSIDGFSSLGAQSNWLEIDCRMNSARFIDFK